MALSEAPEPAALVEAGGLDILGLGAVKVGDILAVGEAVVLKVNDSKVTGREDSGFTCEGHRK